MTNVGNTGEIGASGPIGPTGIHTMTGRPQDPLRNDHFFKSVESSKNIEFTEQEKDQLKATYGKEKKKLIKKIKAKYSVK